MDQQWFLPGLLMWMGRNDLQQLPQSREPCPQGESAGIFCWNNWQTLKWHLSETILPIGQGLAKCGDSETWMCEFPKWQRHSCMCFIDRRWQRNVLWVITMGLFEQRDMYNWMNVYGWWKIQTISDWSDALKNREGNEITRHELVNIMSLQGGALVQL